MLQNVELSNWLVLARGCIAGGREKKGVCEPINASPRLYIARVWFAISSVLN